MMTPEGRIAEEISNFIAFLVDIYDSTDEDLSIVELVVGKDLKEFLYDAVIRGCKDNGLDAKIVLRQIKF